MDGRRCDDVVERTSGREVEGSMRDGGVLKR